MEIKFDFFKISHEEKDKTLDSVLNEISELSLEARIRNIYKIPNRVHDLMKSSDRWFGSFMKIRMSNETLPEKAKLNGDIEPINFEEDQGLGEKVGFLYDPDHKILVLQRSRYSIGAGGAKYYFERIGKFTFHMEPIIQENALQRLKHKDNIRRFELKMVRPPGKIQKEIKGVSASKALDLIDEFDSYYIDIKFGFDNTKLNKGKVLNKQAIVNLANKIIGAEVEDVEKFRVYGDERDVEKYNFVDLIKDRIVEIAQANVQRDNRMTFTWMNDLLNTAYETRRREIILQYFEEE
ncbi:DUF6731 family protein [Paenibacillus sp. BT-177]|uniref:DUF6731 family protein n=1 Tax=Paenibacillus sp. BT-177 TaxID=2986930 RepID=UPI0021F6A322|nr:hypothetical protein [Paenibacillus sp. BT-177]